ncbi:hypothetical protein C0992_006861 [Termitomyces sp. T32_za158]|nr:hypothetical protein C0992_006861 [Termitomyces sp. T32_za158]
MASLTQAYVLETYPDEVLSSSAEFSDSDTVIFDSDYNDNNNNGGSNDNDGGGNDDNGSSNNNNSGGDNDDGDHRPDTIEVEGAEESQLKEDGFQGNLVKLLPVSHRFSSSSMMTCSSSAANISSILDVCQTLPSTVQDERKSPPELLSDVRHLCMQMKACLNRISSLEAELTAMHHELSDFWTQLDNTRAKKTRSSTKIKAHFLTHSELKEAFEKEEVECQKWEQINAEREAQKARDVAECSAWINEDSVLKTFNYSLSHYKKKDDLITIASAFVRYR